MKNKVPVGCKMLYAVRLADGNYLTMNKTFRLYPGEVAMYTRGEAIKKARMFDGCAVSVPATYQDRQGRRVTDLRLLRNYWGAKAVQQ